MVMQNIKPCCPTDILLSLVISQTFKSHLRELHWEETWDIPEVRIFLFDKCDTRKTLEHKTKFLNIGDYKIKTKIKAMKKKTKWLWIIAGPDYLIPATLCTLQEYKHPGFKQTNCPKERTITAS